MSLVVWLPLTKDLRNQGLNNMTFSSTNTTNIVEDSAGKLGKCYKRSTKQTTGRIISNTTINLSADFSMCCWAKVMDCVGDTANGLVSNHSHSDNTGFGITVKQVSTSDYRISCNTGTGSGRTYNTYYGTSNIKDAWHHLAITYDKATTQLKLWVDGVCEKNVTYTSGSKADYIILFDWSTTYDSTNYRPAAAMNDVRIYDHCLSPMEIKELAKGLVLHYPLSSGNLIDINNITDGAYLNSNGGITGTNGWCYTDYIPVYSNSQYVCTGLSKGGSGTYIVLYDNTKTKTRTLLLTANQNLDITTNDIEKYIRLSIRELANELTTTARFVYISPIEYDCSGFCNNGTKTGTFTWTSDTPKYVVSQTFSGSQYITTTDEITTTDSTIAMWIKTSLSANAFILDCRNSGGAGKQPIYQYPNGSIQSGGASQYVMTNNGLLVANTWVHLALVQSGNSLLVYKNGSLFQTLSCTNSPIIKPTIGARYTLTGLLPSGSLSDFRIYATALSADDVKSLYQNSAYIDSSGNVYGAVHMEV